MYEESLKMPFICRWPGVVKAGSVNKSLIQNLDYAETFLDLAGADIPDDMQGASLVPLMKGEQPSDWRDAIYYHYHEYPSVHMVARHYGIRDGRYKLIRFYQFDEWEFYDLENDPDEVENQYSNPKYAQTVERMKVQLEQMRKHYKDDTDISVLPEVERKKFRVAAAK